ncbi:MAG: hypothetical protein ACREN7_06215 [Candidatus Dormibacteria bacterium]
MLGIGTFQAVAAPPTVLAPVAVKGRLRAPREVVAGTTLAYDVVLTNPARHAIAEACPAYAEALVSGGHRYKVIDTYRLNCGPRLRLGPRASRTFAMRLATHVAVGSFRVRLTWSFWAPSGPLTLEPRSGLEAVITVQGRRAA